MNKLDSSHVERAISSVDEVVTSLGFKRRTRQRYVKNAADGVVHGVTFDANLLDDELRLTPSFVIFHNVAGRLIENAVGGRRQEVGDFATDAALHNRPVKLLAATGREQASSPDYVISDPLQIGGVLQKLSEDLLGASSQFFSSQATLDLLIARIETDDEAGGERRLAVLMALYFVASRLNKLLPLARRLEVGVASPATIAMRDYLLRRLRDDG